MSKIVRTFLAGEAWKSVAGGVVSGLGAALAYLASVVDDGVKASEWMNTLGAFLTAFVAGSGIVYATKNRQPTT